MRSHDDPAVDRVIVYQVVRDQVVVGLAGIVADEYPSGVAKDDVVGHDRMIDSGQMDSLAAVVVFTGFERRQARTRERRNYQTLVIIEYPVTHDGDSGGVGDQDSFEFGILHLKPSHHNDGKARIIDTVDVDTVGQAGSVDGSGAAACPDQRQRLPNHDIFFACAHCHFDGVIGRSGRDGGVDTGKTPGCAAGIHAQVARIIDTVDVDTVGQAGSVDGSGAAAIDAAGL